MCVYKTEGRSRSGSLALAAPQLSDSLDSHGGTDVRRFASAVASLPLLLCVGAGEAQQAGKPADWLPYGVSSEMPRKVKPAALDKIRSGMTLGQVVELLGKGWVPPNSGTGIITWGWTG